MTVDIRNKVRGKCNPWLVLNWGHSTSQYYDYANQSYAVLLVYMIQAKRHKDPKFTRLFDLQDTRWVGLFFNLLLFVTLLVRQHYLFLFEEQNPQLQKPTYRPPAVPCRKLWCSGLLKGILTTMLRQRIFWDSESEKRTTWSYWQWVNWRRKLNSVWSSLLCIEDNM